MQNMQDTTQDVNGTTTAPGEPAEIVAAHLTTKEESETLCDELVAEGLPRDEVHCFWSNAPGQHSITPIGGDRSADPDAKPASTSVVMGAAGGGTLGAVVGAVGAASTGMVDPVLGVAVASAVGAYGGGLMGALSGMKGADGKTEVDETIGTGEAPGTGDATARAADNAVPRFDTPGNELAEDETSSTEARPPASMISVRVGSWDRQRIVSRLRRAGAEDIEVAQGHWNQGQWIDYDPRKPPQRV
ncbi:MAG: hypothetical protein IPK20_18340 [Betaproteobacteria bacterium]|nr:hypothetical protein [Betaproteobacteria bacterium]